MSNSLSSNPIYIDTFSADVTISSVPISVRKIWFYTGTSPDTLVLEDLSGVISVRATTTANNLPVEIDFADSGFLFPSLIMDVSDGDYGGTPFLLIYLK